MQREGLGGSRLSWPLNVPVLSDGVVTLRAATPADVADVFEMSQDRDMQRFTAIPLPHTREMSEEFVLRAGPQQWDAGTGRYWAIEAEDDDGRARYAGAVDVRGADPVTTVGYALHPWARGRGIMARAVRLAVDHVLTEGGVEAVHWAAHVGNEASLRVAHACGFELVGTTPAMLHERGRTIDAWTAVIRFGDAPVPGTRWLDAPVVEAGPVRLRPWREDDVPRIVEACSDPRSRHWLNTLPARYTTDDARTFLHRTTWNAATGHTLSWAVADSATDVLLASLSIMDLLGPNPGTGEVGYWAHPDARGRGVMTTAVRAALPHAFAPEGLGLQRLSLLAAAGNTASRAVATRAGFTQVGVEREAELLGDDTVDDLVMYDLLATDAR